ncbi:MAG: hypothetical protein HOO97_10355 [Sideroxydans sp.]|nr:hypothetical protein [Sideroxydans sp.]
MKRIITAAILLINAQYCIAAGLGELSGTNKNGDLLVVYEAIGRSQFNIQIIKGGVASEGNIKTYEDQKCEFEYNNIGKPTKFSCVNSGKTPLSGASYKITPYKKPDCNHQFMYICTHGCDNPEAPTKLIEASYECN